MPSLAGVVGWNGRVYSGGDGPRRQALPAAVAFVIGGGVNKWINDTNKAGGDVIGFGWSFNFCFRWRHSLYCT
jgi:hypothetical protein